MFGEKDIFGVERIISDKKSRITIPLYTGISSDDELVLFKKDNYYEIFSRTRLDEMIMDIENNRKSSILNENQYQELIDSIYLRTLVDGFVDKQKRFYTHGYLAAGLYKCIGARKSIYIMTDQDYEKQLSKGLLY